MDAETPQMPTPEYNVADMSLSNPIFLDMKNPATHTTGNDWKADAKISGALLRKLVSSIFAPSSTIAIFINSSPRAESLSQVDIGRRLAAAIPTISAIIYPISALPMTFTKGE
jgi:hypothetical protein